MSLPHLYGMLPDDLARHLRARDLRVGDQEARRLLAHVLSPDHHALQRHPLSSRLIAEMRASTSPERLEIIERAVDPRDGFVKYLLRSPDGALSEAVRIPLAKPGAFSVCLSSQVGCAMGCAFCATARLGFRRHLAAWEMVDAFLHVRDEAPGRITGVVFQGQGEPLLNYDEVIRAAQVLSHPCGAKVSGTAISISTVGLPREIRRFAEERHRFRLIVSLTSALSERRRQLLPLAGRVPLDELAQAIRAYAAVSRGRTTIAWVMMAGVNTGQDEVDALHALLGDLRLRLNLIDVNDARADGFRPPSDEERHAFMDRLQVLRAPLVRRYSGGAARHAACGMLASIRCGRETEPT